MSKLKLYHGNDDPRSNDIKKKRAGTFGAMYQDKSKHVLNLKKKGLESKKK